MGNVVPIVIEIAYLQATPLLHIQYPSLAPTGPPNAPSVLHDEQPLRSRRSDGNDAVGAARRWRRKWRGGGGDADDVTRDCRDVDGA